MRVLTKPLSLLIPFFLILRFAEDSLRQYVVGRCLVSFSALLFWNLVPRKGTGGEMDLKSLFDQTGEYNNDVV